MRIKTKTHITKSVLGVACAIGLGMLLTAAWFGIFKNLNQEALAQIGPDCVAIQGRSTEVQVNGVANAGQFLFDHAAFPPDANKGCVNEIPMEATADIVKFKLTGWVWNSNLGWVSLSCDGGSNAGKACGPIDYTSYLEIKPDNPETASLTGFWWGDNIGWISLNCPNSEWAACNAARAYGANAINLAAAVANYVTIDNRFMWSPRVGWMNVAGVKIPYTQDMQDAIADAFGLNAVTVDISTAPDAEETASLMEIESENPQENDANLDATLDDFVTANGTDAYEIVVAIKKEGVLIQDGDDYLIDIIGHWCDKVRFDQVEGAPLGECRAVAGASPVKVPNLFENGDWVFDPARGYIGKLSAKAPTSADDTIILQEIAVYIRDLTTGEVYMDYEEFEQNIQFEFMPGIEIHRLKARQQGGGFEDSITAAPDETTEFQARVARYRAQVGDALPANNLVTLKLSLDVQGGYDFTFEENDSDELVKTLDNYLNANQKHRTHTYSAQVGGNGAAVINEKLNSEISYDIAGGTVRYPSKSLRSLNEDENIDLTAQVVGNVTLNAGFQINQGQINEAVEQGVTAKRDGFYRRVRTMLRGQTPEPLIPGNITNVNVDNFGNTADSRVMYYARSTVAIPANKQLVANLALNQAITEERTLVIEGGDARISKNIIADGGRFGIIVLKDAKGAGGNVYINEDVTDIHANIFADGTVFSFTGGALNADGSPAALDTTRLGKQLTIVGTVVSNNSYGGAAQEQAIKGDGSIAANQAEARLYDLNWLRYSPLMLQMNDQGQVVLPDGTTQEFGDADLTKPFEAGGSLTWPADLAADDFSVASFGNIGEAKKNYPVNIIYDPPTQTMPGF